jgi:hypothetical protein
MKKLEVGFSGKALACLMAIQSAINNGRYDKLSLMAKDFCELDEREIIEVLEASVKCKQNDLVKAAILVDITGILSSIRVKNFVKSFIIERLKNCKDEDSQFWFKEMLRYLAELPECKWP